MAAMRLHAAKSANKQPEGVNKLGDKITCWQAHSSISRPYRVPQSCRHRWQFQHAVTDKMQWTRFEPCAMVQDADFIQDSLLVTRRLIPDHQNVLAALQYELCKMPTCNTTSRQNPFPLNPHLQFDSANHRQTYNTCLCCAPGAEPGI